MNAPLRQAIAASEVSEQALQLLVDSLPALVWRTTPDGETDYVNQQLTLYTGRVLADLGPLNWKYLVHPDDVENTAQVWEGARASGVPFEALLRLRSKEGSYRWFHIRGAPLLDEQGRILHWFGVNIDVDDRERTREAYRYTPLRTPTSRPPDLAELTASIAHEISQPLAAVVANGHACQRWLAGDPPNLERARLSAERIIRDANSAASIVDRIRNLPGDVE